MVERKTRFGQLGGRCSSFRFPLVAAPIHVSEWRFPVLHRRCRRVRSGQAGNRRTTPGQCYRHSIGYEGQPPAEVWGGLSLAFSFQQSVLLPAVSAVFGSDVPPPITVHRKGPVRTHSRCPSNLPCLSPFA